MKTADLEGLSKSNARYPQYKRNSARIFGISILAALALAGCEGGTVAIGVPEISNSVPALPDDPLVDNALVDNTLATDLATDDEESPDSVLIDDPAAEPELPDVPVLPAEGLTQDQPLILDTEDEPESEAPIVPETAPEIVPEVEAVAATNVGLSPQAQAILSGALSRGGMRIMPVGDSITHGIGGMQSYRRELADLLSAAGCSFRMVGSQSQSFSDTGYYGAHEAYSGHTAGDFLSGLSNESGSNPGISVAVNYQKPDMVLLHIGSNDLYLGQTIDSTIVEIAQIIDTIYENKPDTVVVIANIIPWLNVSQDTGMPDAIRALGNKVQELVRGSGNPLLSVADVRTGFTEGMFLHDLVHPNLEGDIHIANAIFDSFYSAAICN